MTDFLIATNGFKGTWPAIEYGAWLAGHLQMNVTLLGVNEKLNPAQIDDHHPLEDIFEKAVNVFKENGVTYHLEVQNGDAEELISRKANEGDFIAITAPLGRARLRRWLMGRSIRHLMEEIKGPILYAPQARIPMKKILICIGGLGYEVTAEHITMQMAKKCDAELILLHVIPPIELDYHTTRVVSQNWRHISDTDTPQGRSLRQAMEVAQEMGLSVHVNVRQGNIVEEILEEMKTSDYDLLCMGSPFSGNALRQLYAPNVTAEISEAAHCPVLTARYQQKK